MNHKFAAMIFALWLTVMILLFYTPAKGAVLEEKQQPTCEMASEDIEAAKIRYLQLKDMFAKAQTHGGKIVLAHELDALEKLIISIHGWQVENCKEA